MNKIANEMIRSGWHMHQKENQDGQKHGLFSYRCFSFEDSERSKHASSTHRREKGEKEVEEKDTRKKKKTDASSVINGLWTGREPDGKNNEHIFIKSSLHSCS